MTAARRKGNVLESWWARKIHEVDGMDPVYEQAQTETGRLGPAFHLRTDVVSLNVAAECKNRENIAKSLWEWLDQMSRFKDKAKVVVLKRNRRDPLVLMYAEDYLELLAAAKRGGWGR